VKKSYSPNSAPSAFPSRRGDSDDEGKTGRFTRCSHGDFVSQGCRDFDCEQKRQDAFDAAMIDEFGYLPVPPQTAHLLLQLVAACYERGSILITSNQGLADWGRTLGDAVVATAILDRLLHHIHVITIQGVCYRLRTKHHAGIVSRREPKPTPVRTA